MYLNSSIARIKEARKENLAEFLRARFLSGGIELAWVDFIPTKSALFVHFPDGFLSPCIVHEAVRNDLEFQRYGAPRYHFAGCEDMLRLSQESDAKIRYIASLKRENLFSFKTLAGRSELRFFRDRPLEECERCRALAGGLSLAELSARKIAPLFSKEMENLKSAMIALKGDVCDVCLSRQDSLELFLEGEKIKMICKKCGNH